MLRRLIYVSASVMRDPRSHATEILRVARRNNERAGLTGCLIFTDGGFFQVIEGEHDAVEATFRRISKDTRHRRLIKLFDGDAEDRAFPDFAMNGHMIAPDDPIANEIRRISTVDDVKLRESAGALIVQTLIRTFLSSSRA